MTDDVLDGSVLARLEEDVGGHDVLVEVLQEYLDEAPRLLDAALAAPEPTVVSRHAHALKSSSAAVGALALSSLCLRLETQGAAGDRAGVDATLPQVAAELERVRERMRRLCGPEG